MPIPHVKRFFSVLTIRAITISAIPYQVTAEPKPITLSVATFPGLEPLVEPILKRYERSNTAVHIVLKPLEKFPLKPGTSPQATLEGYLKQLEEAASSADIVMV